MTRAWRHVGASTAGTLLGNVLSLALPFVVTAWFAPSATTDAFFYALGAILFLNVAISVALESATTPMVTTMLATEADGSARHRLRKVQCQGVLVCALVTITGVAVINGVLVGHSSFDGEARADVLVLTSVLAVLPVLVSWNAVPAGALYALKVFGLPTASVGMRTAAALLAGLAFREQWGILAIPIGLVAGEVLRVVLLEWALRRQWFLRLPTVRHGSVPAGTDSRSFWRSAGPQSVAMSLGGISPVVDKTVAIGVGVGGVTILELSQRLVYAPVLFLLSGVGLVLGARWAEQVAQSRWSLLRVEYRRARSVVFVLGAGIVLTGVPIVFLFRDLAESRLSISDPTLLAWTFTAAALGIPFALVSQVSVRVLIAMGETRVMPVLTACTVMLNLGLDLALVDVWGLPGIACASAVVNVFNAVIYGVLVRKRLDAAGGLTCRRDSPNPARQTVDAEGARP